jgi:hypothetical protein
MHFRGLYKPCFKKLYIRAREEVYFKQMYKMLRLSLVVLEIFQHGQHMLRGGVHGLYVCETLSQK